jgi:hypothetical protein
MIYEFMNAVRPIPNPTPMEPHSAALVVLVLDFLAFVSKHGGKS